MGKQLGNSGKRKKPFWPKPAHQFRARARAPAATYRRTSPVSARLPALSSLSRSLPSGAKLSAPVPFAHAPLFPLCLVGPLCEAPSRYPRAPVLSLSLSLSAPWACAISSALPTPAVDQRARTCARRRNPRPRRPPHAPPPLFEPRPCRTHSPTSFHAVPLPLALCSRRQTSPEFLQPARGLFPAIPPSDLGLVATTPPPSLSSRSAPLCPTPATPKPP
jgi:hypothetical protein